MKPYQIFNEGEIVEVNGNNWNYFDNQELKWINIPSKTSVTVLKDIGLPYQDRGYVDIEFNNRRGYISGSALKRININK